jgi:hypothetical protein
VTTLSRDAPELVLDEEAAERVWNWILTRQGLADSRRLDTAQEVADAVLGLHSARLPSPYTIVASRTADPSAPQSLFTAPVRASLLTLRCMRKTLHTLPLALAAAAHAATRGFRERDARRAVHNAGYAVEAIDALTGRVCELLTRGPLSHRAIESHLADAGYEVRETRLAIKVAWERGVIAYANASGAWNRESRTFALTASAYPALDLSLSRSQATTTLVTAYFQRYGPATVRDAAWWSGLSGMDICTALLESGRPLITVATPWSPAPCLMFADQTGEALGNQAVTGVQLLAHEDSALKAYYETRGRYLSDVPPRRAFNQIGEALPAVIIDGLTVGTWSWDSRARRVRTQLLPGKAKPGKRGQVRERAAVLTEVLRCAWVPGPYPGGRFQTRQSACHGGPVPTKVATLADSAEHTR